jgi:hypothetical protein
MKRKAQTRAIKPKKQASVRKVGVQKRTKNFVLKSSKYLLDPIIHNGDGSRKLMSGRLRYD